MYLTIELIHFILYKQNGAFYVYMLKASKNVKYNEKFVIFGEFMLFFCLIKCNRLYIYKIFTE